MASAIFFLGISMILICSFSLTPAILLFFKTKKETHLYICLLLASYLIELIELLYIARFCLPDDIRYFNLIHFPVLRIFTTVSILLLDLLLLLRIVNLKFRKGYLLLFAAVILFCAYIACLPRTLLTVWLFYMPRQLYHFGYCVVFLLRRFLEKDEAVRKKMEHYSFLVLAVFLLSVSILLEDTLLISHIQTYFTDMLSVTERNFSENILWLFIILYSLTYCIRELEHGSTSLPVSGAASPHLPVPMSASGAVPGDTGTAEKSGMAGTAPESALSGYLADKAETYKFTPRETQILDCILQYKTTAEICEELNISTGTVKTHTHNIYMKVNVKSRRELIRALTE